MRGDVAFDRSRLGDAERGAVGCVAGDPSDGPFDTIVSTSLYWPFKMIHNVSLPVMHEIYHQIGRLRLTRSAMRRCVTLSDGTTYPGSWIVNRCRGRTQYYSWL